MTLPHPTPWNLSELSRLAARCLTTVDCLTDCTDCGRGLWLPLAENPLWDPDACNESDQEAALGVGIPVGKVLAITCPGGAMAAMAGVFLGSGITQWTQPVI